MLFYEPPNHCPSISSLLAPSHGVTCKGARTVFLNDGKPKATACRGLRCDILTAIASFYLKLDFKSFVSKTVKKSCMSLPFQFQWVPTDLTTTDEVRAQLSQYDYFKNNKRVQKGDCICLSTLKFKHSCTDAISW